MAEVRLELPGGDARKDRLGELEEAMRFDIAGIVNRVARSSGSTV